MTKQGHLKYCLLKLVRELIQHHKRQFNLSLVILIVMPIKLLPREDDSSGESQYLESLTQEYKKIGKRRPPISTETKVTQD